MPCSGIIAAVLAFIANQAVNFGKYAVNAVRLRHGQAAAFPHRLRKYAQPAAPRQRFYQKHRTVFAGSNFRNRKSRAVFRCIIGFFCFRVIQPQAAVFRRARQCLAVHFGKRQYLVRTGILHYGINIAVNIKI